MNDYRWITSDIALAIHERQLAEHGGQSGLRDENLLESALARPQQLFAYGNPPPDVCQLAAAYAHGLAKIIHFLMEINAQRTSFIAFS